MPDTGLAEAAQEFADDLTRTVRGVIGDHVEQFLATGTTALTADGKTRIRIHQEPRDGIPLTIDGITRLKLVISMNCIWDHADAYLAVDVSGIEVVPTCGGRQPLFRYEYTRTPTSTQACAHVQVHAHRDVATYLMTLPSLGSTRSKRRGKKSEDGIRMPQLSDLHLPVGGPRFRPCVEDVLEMLIDDFGVDHQDNAKDAIRGGREQWRNKQLGAAVRDNPRKAAEVLIWLGYTVEPPEGGHPEGQLARLHAL